MPGLDGVKSRMKLAVANAKLTYLLHFGFHYVFLKLVTKELDRHHEALLAISDPPS